ncbi:DUF6519 domain-containing protein [Streptomyces decoyicus]
MPGDYARMTFNRLDDFNRPWLQQGRVLLEADLNELADALDHRLRALALDVLGPCTAPLDIDAGPGPEATGFQITAGETSFTVGLGRLYVHGLELDNHGAEPWHVEPGLRDLRGSAPVRYETQPYYPHPPALPVGRHLVYVDAWEREVTAVEDPRLTDPGVGVDTAARVQTVWQVKVLPDDATGVDCSTPDDEVPGWPAATAPSAARLTTETVGMPADTDPCSVPPDGGYRGWENRLYRVEVHDGGTLGEATFKWSRDNASVATAVLGVDSTRTVLTVARTGRDDVQRIREGAHVEVLDDARELSGRPGFMSQVLTVDGVDEFTQLVTLAAALPLDFDPATAARRTRLRQWDHSGPAVGADGTLKVSDTLAAFVLEDGVQVTFAAEPALGLLRTGDHWSFAARSADASVQRLSAAPPQGVRHFYGRLAVVDLPGRVTDCRTVWEPANGCGDCTVCVTPHSHASGRLTIQMAVDRVRATGGKICLKSGHYELDTPVVIRSGRSLTLSGHGWNTVVSHPADGPAVVLLGCRGVTVRDLSIVAGRSHATPPDARTADCDGSVAVGIAVANSSGVEVVRCRITTAHAVQEGVAFDEASLHQRTRTAAGGTPGLKAPMTCGTIQEAAIAPIGTVDRLAVRHCVLRSGFGIVPLYLLAPPAEPDGTGSWAAGLGSDYLLLTDFGLAGSVVIAGRTGVWLDERAITALGARIHESVVWGGQGPAVSWGAHPLGGLSLTVHGCTFRGARAGVELASHGADLSDTRIAGQTALAGDDGPDNGSGVLLDASALAGTLADVRVRGCVVTAEGYGVAFRGDQRRVEISGCRVDGAEGGVVMLPAATGQQIVVRENDVRSTAGTRARLQPLVAGIWLVQVTHGEVRGNHVWGIEAGEAGYEILMGVAAEECRSVTVADNTITGLTTQDGAESTVAIAAWPSYERFDVIDNVIDSGPGSSGDGDDFPEEWAIFVSAQGGSDARVASGGAEADAEADGAARAVGPAGHRARVFAEASAGVRSELSDGRARVTPWQVFALPGAVTPATTVQGNRIEAHGNVTAVLMQVAGPLLFSDNLVRRTVTVSSDHPPTVVSGWSTSLVASANHVEADGVPMDLATAPERAAVVGNVTDGQIRISGAPLGEPWHSMNIRL